MSAVLALPATVRLPRTVAVRRALLAGLFLVGFVALGFAFGPGAHADDRAGSAELSGATAPARPAAEASTPDRAATRDGASRLSGSRAAVTERGEESGARFAERTHAASDTVTQAVRPAVEQTAPVTEPVGRVVREIGDSAGAALPVHLPSGEHAGHPGDGGPHGHGRTPGEAPSAGSRTAATVDRAAAAEAVQLLDDLRKPVSEGSSATVHEQRDPGHDGLPGQYPQGPVAPASHTAGDGHGPRGGDQYAAAPADPTRFRLLPGGVRTADGAPTRRRAEEILEFPG